jgi:hypothetical protein
MGVLVGGVALAGARRPSPKEAREGGPWGSQKKPPREKPRGGTNEEKKMTFGLLGPAQALPLRESPGSFYHQAKLSS